MRASATSSRRAMSGPRQPNGKDGGKSIELVHVTQTFTSNGPNEPLTALADVSIRIEPGQFVSIVGPTGCGKSTTLSAISGLQAPTEGDVFIAEEPVKGVREDVGFVFQQDALLPWRTALENVELGLRFRGVGRKEARSRASDWLARVGLGQFGHSYPHQLSGGMRKRVAIAATLVYEPTILLMDEPFSALDIQTRTLMETDLLAVWQEVGHQTVVFVTHDLEEAIGLSDRVIVLSARPGHVVGDYPVDLLRPRDLLRLKVDPAFTDLYRTIWSDLEGEVRKVTDGAAYRARVDE